MHSAPSVTYPVGRSRFLGQLLILGWLAGAGAGVVLWRFHGVSGWRLMVIAVALTLSGGLAWRFWRGLPDRQLRWDGQTWRLLVSESQASAGPAARLAVHLDLQRHLMLRLRGTDGTGSWLWAEAATDPARWHALRCAVYSRAMTDAQSDAGAANP
jgi:toxin CptA